MTILDNTHLGQGAEDDLSFSLHAVEAARRARSGELARKLQDLGIAPSGRQQITWVGDLQQGDGGKGAMVDRLAANHQIVVRVQGGDNAGHTSIYTGAEGDEVEVKTHLVPSGLRNPGTVGVLGNGVLVNPERLAAEVVGPLEGRVFVSERAHLVLPLHRLVDELHEARRRRSGFAIGTTLRGIGPANASKTNRSGLRVYDLRDMDLVRARIAANVEYFGLPAAEADENYAWLRQYRELLLGAALDSRAFLTAAIEQGYSVLAEGAQGPLIDIEQGIYPYVTTSSTSVHSVALGAGISSGRIDNRIGVLKAYQTMVGNGAFVSEDHGAVRDYLRDAGAEFGTTTGRPRRCGWLDLPHARWAVEINGYTTVVVTKLDVLDGLDEIGLCVGYLHKGRPVYEFVAEHEFLKDCEPVYRYLPGWKQSTRGITAFGDLPTEARRFVEYVRSYLGVDVAGVTKGPRDSDLLVDPESTGARQLVR
jgi:adenylosuccinate synthase